MDDTSEFQNDTLPEGFGLTGTAGDEPEEDHDDEAVDPLLEETDPLAIKKPVGEEEEDGFEEFVALQTEYDDDSSY